MIDAINGFEIGIVGSVMSITKELDLTNPGNSSAVLGIGQKRESYFRGKLIVSLQQVCLKQEIERSYQYTLIADDTWYKLVMLWTNIRHWCLKK